MEYRELKYTQYFRSAHSQDAPVDLTKFFMIQSSLHSKSCCTILSLQKAFKALGQSTHLYGRRLVLEWADDASDDLLPSDDYDTSAKFVAGKTAEKFHKEGNYQSRELVVLQCYEKRELFCVDVYGIFVLSFFKWYTLRQTRETSSDNSGKKEGKMRCVGKRDEKNVWSWVNESNNTCTSWNGLGAKKGKIGEQIVASVVLYGAVGVLCVARMKMPKTVTFHSVAPSCFEAVNSRQLWSAPKNCWNKNPS